MPPFDPATTTGGGHVTVALTRGMLRADAEFDLGPGGAFFQLGCVRRLPPHAEITGAFVPDSAGSYIPLADYWMPPLEDLRKLFAGVGVSIDPPAYAPVIKNVLRRSCANDRDPTNNRGITNPGILVVEAEIGFQSTSTQAVIASTSTDASGAYEFELSAGTYLVCGGMQTGWRETAPAGTTASCAGTNADVSPRGRLVSLSATDETVDFGNAPLGDVQLWLGLKSSDDQGTSVDIKVELLKNGTPVASGLRRCVTGLRRNPSAAKAVAVQWDPFEPVSLEPADALVLKISTRIGTNADETKCGPASSHTGAVGVRLYYDAADRAAGLDANLGSDSNQHLYLSSDGTVCPAGGGESVNVTQRDVKTWAPTFVRPRCKDSSAISVAGENPFKELGTWKLR
jgi:hypothetical protein